MRAKSADLAVAAGVAMVGTVTGSMKKAGADLGSKIQIDARGAAAQAEGYCKWLAGQQAHRAAIQEA